MSCNKHDKASQEEIEKQMKEKAFKLDLLLDDNKVNPPRKKSDWHPSYRPSSWNRSSK